MSYESEEQIIQRHRPLTRELPAPRPQSTSTKLAELLDEISDACRRAGLPLPGSVE